MSAQNGKCYGRNLFHTSFDKMQVIVEKSKSNFDMQDLSVEKNLKVYTKKVALFFCPAQPVIGLH